MSIPSLEFLIVVLLLSTVFSWLQSAHLRRGLLSLLSAWFLVGIVPDSASAIGLGVFVLSGWLAAIALTRRPSSLGMAGYITLLVFAFVVLRKYELLRYFLPLWLLEHPIGIVGLSYMLFRQIQYVVDSGQGQIQRHSLWRYLNYQLNLFTILAGPIQRYQDFEASWATLKPSFAGRHELAVAYLRLLWGIVLMTLIAPACLDLYDQAVAKTEWARSARVALFFYSYPAYVYLNFAGYSSVVIAGASLLGLRLPENFDRPYVARNMIEFWNRWHITLSHWLRDYLFTPSYKALAQRWPTRASSLVPLCYFMVFVVAGVWHGSSANWVVFGLMHGAGVSVAKMWENHLIRRGGRKGLKQYLQSRKIRVAATLLNFHFVCSTFLFFPEGLRLCIERISYVLIGGAG